MQSPPSFKSIDLDDGPPAGDRDWADPLTLQGLYVGLLGPNDKEIKGGAYQRQFIELRSPETSRSIIFPKASKTWGEVTGFAIYDEYDATLALLTCDFAAPTHVGTADSVTISLESLQRTVAGKNKLVSPPRTRSR